MGTNDCPKRPWFRFHLLTAVLMTIAAGAMLYPCVQFCRPVIKDGWAGKLAERGFNMVVVFGTIYVVAAAYFMVLIVVGRFCESILRRREARKP